jgi:hypothetical protein
MNTLCVVVMVAGSGLIAGTCGVWTAIGVSLMVVGSMIGLAAIADEVLRP